MFLLTAYQLRVCQPPPEVPNADTLMEDGELEIGECGGGNVSVPSPKWIQLLKRFEMLSTTVQAASLWFHPQSQ